MTWEKNSVEFQAFPKLARLSRGCVISEKLDGTNGQIYIYKDESGELQMEVGSRNRWLMVGDDNYGFFYWANTNKDDLLKLGEGRHYGEWYGKGIQRGYGLGNKQFALFNTSRWSDPLIRPNCCGVVPVLYAGVFNDTAVDTALQRLRDGGSVAVPGWDDPEGVVVYHSASGTMFKKTLVGDESPKSLISA
jgi:hypothetical protein